jgi:hypothetical protein
MIIAATGRISVNADAVRDDDSATISTGTALVPIIAPVERPPISRSMARHDAFYVTQLIAMAQHSLQTRVLCRAAPQVAQAAYHSTNEQNQDRAQTGTRLLRVA